MQLTGINKEKTKRAEQENIKTKTFKDQLLSIKGQKQNKKIKESSWPRRLGL